MAFLASAAAVMRSAKPVFFRCDMNLLVGGKCAPKTPKRCGKQLIIPSPRLGRMDADPAPSAFADGRFGLRGAAPSLAEGSAAEPRAFEPSPIRTGDHVRAR